LMLTKAMPVNEALAKATTDPKVLETLRLKSALAGFADPVVWLVLAAFFAPWATTAALRIALE